VEQQQWRKYHANSSNKKNLKEFLLQEWGANHANGSNKTNLKEFLLQEWGSNQRFAEKIRDRTLYVTHGEICYKIFEDVQGRISSRIVLQLCSHQEEADT